MRLVGATIEDGMISQPVKDVEKPCTNCLLTRMQAGLEYTDGRQATISNGMWLHHMVAMATGTGKADATCANAAMSLPHMSFLDGTITAKNTERFFASGNERTPIDLTQTGSYGYRVNAGDRFHLLVELMNMTAVDTPVYLTVDYSYVDGNAAGFHTVRPVWLDARNCGTSEAPAQTGQYTLKSTPWISTVSGTLVASMGHLHDGGDRLTFQKGGSAFCTSVASYGTSPDYVDNPGDMPGMEHGGGGATHISEMTHCTNGSSLRAGDSLAITGYYDTAKYPEMTHAGKLHAIMALGLLYYAP